MTIEPGKGLNLAPELIKQLVPGPLDRATINEQLAALKKAIFERAPGGELTHHPGHEKGEAKPLGRTNHRNGTSPKHIDRLFGQDRVRLDIALAAVFEQPFDIGTLYAGDGLKTEQVGPVADLFHRWPPESISQPRLPDEHDRE